MKTLPVISLLIGGATQVAIAQTSLYDQVNARRTADQAQTVAHSHQLNLRVAKAAVESESKSKVTYGPQFEPKNRYLYYTMANGAICGLAIAGTPDNVMYVYSSTTYCR